MDALVMDTPLAQPREILAQRQGLIVEPLAEHARLRAENAPLRAENGVGRGFVAQLQERMAELEAKLGPPSGKGTPDFVKAKDTMAALDRVAGVSFGGVASLQNGMAKNSQLAERFGWPAVIGCATIVGATLLEPGKALHTMFGVTYFGELDGRRSQRVEKLASAFNEAGMKTEIPASIMSAEWSKLCQIVPAALLSSVIRLEYCKVCKSRDLAELFVTITHECAAVAKGCGIEVGDYQGFPIRSIVEAPFEKAVEMILARGASLE